jgi:hypothetical protein
LPVSTPPASGDQAVTPMFSAFAIGISSRSTVRSIRLYFDLQADEVRPPAQLRQRVGISDAPAWWIAQAIFHRRYLVPDANPI